VPKPLDKSQIEHIVGAFNRWWASRAKGQNAAIQPLVSDQQRPPQGAVLAEPRQQLAGHSPPVKVQPPPPHAGNGRTAVISGEKHVVQLNKDKDRGSGYPSTTSGEKNVQQRNKDKDSTTRSRASYSPGDINIIVAGDDAICSMALVTTLTLVGVEDDLILQADSKDSLMEAFGQIQGDARPLILFLGNALWLSSVRQVIASLSATSAQPCVSKPYVVCADEDGEKGIRNFDATLPVPYLQADLEKMLVACHRSWTLQ